ncbi:MAG: hypothetical protein KDD55_02275 [Bdellovibrionales bacterium]|nr:hypothetical protein [Bdellovibrionales bacterium]
MSQFRKRYRLLVESIKKVKDWNSREKALLGIVCSCLLLLFVALPAGLIIGGVSGDSRHPDVRYHYTLSPVVGESSFRTQGFEVAEDVILNGESAQSKEFLARRFSTSSPLSDQVTLRGSYARFTAQLNREPLKVNVMGYGSDLLVELEPSTKRNRQELSSELQLHYALQGFQSTDSNSSPESFVIPLSINRADGTLAALRIRIELPSHVGVIPGKEEQMVRLLILDEQRRQLGVVEQFSFLSQERHSLRFETDGPVPTNQRYFLALNL